MEWIKERKEDFGRAVFFPDITRRGEEVADQVEYPDRPEDRTGTGTEEVVVDPSFLLPTPEDIPPPGIKDSPKEPRSLLGGSQAGGEGC